MKQLIPVLVVAAVMIAGCVGQSTFTLDESRSIANNAISNDFRGYAETNQTSFDSALNSCTKAYISVENMTSVVLGERSGKCGMYFVILGAQLPGYPVLDMLCQWNMSETFTTASSDMQSHCEGPMMYFMSQAPQMIVVNQTQEEILAARAQNFCLGDNVDSVYVCGDNIRVVSSLLGGGSTFHKLDGSQLSCPLVAPDAMSEECKSLLLNATCTEMQVC